MSRNEYLLSQLTKSMSIIEIGASHRPLVPKRAGWKTTIVDHADAEELKRKYAANDAHEIEPVDVVWHGGNLDSHFPSNQIGTYDAIVASHVLEHMPDPIAFFKSCERLLKPTGKILLALPDKRFCFDYFRPITTTGEILSTNALGETVHSKRTSYEAVAYAVKSNDALAWSREDKLSNLTFAHPLNLAKGVFQRATDGRSGPYYDFHAWKFTPSSFSLIMLELRAMNFTKLIIEDILDTQGHEFFTRLALSSGNDDFTSIDKTRMKLLLGIMNEIREQIDNAAQLLGAPSPPQEKRTFLERIARVLKVKKRNSF